MDKNRCIYQARPDTGVLLNRQVKETKNVIEEINDIKVFRDSLESLFLRSQSLAWKRTSPRKPTRRSPILFFKILEDDQLSGFSSFFQEVRPVVKRRNAPERSKRIFWGRAQGSFVRKRNEIYFSFLDGHPSV